MADDVIPVRLEVKSPELRETLGRIVSSTGGFRLRDPGDRGPFEILNWNWGRTLKANSR